MALTKIQPSGIDQTLDYSVDQLTANTVVVSGVNIFNYTSAANNLAQAAFIQANTTYAWGNHATYNYATQTYVGTQISNLVNAAPTTLDTLNELATALGNDANFATTVTNNIGDAHNKANTAFNQANTSLVLANAAFTAANTGAGGTNTTTVKKIAGGYSLVFGG
jgi:hypothetical protein